VKKSDVVRAVLGDRYHVAPLHHGGQAFAPTNIALCKYWGKRDQDINLPLTSSLSISLGNKGATVDLRIHHGAHDEIFLNEYEVDRVSPFSKRLIEFLNLFRHHHEPRFSVHIKSNVPIAAGLASSACGFASLIMALDALFGWKLDQRELSILARLGSGSATRSLWPGFVEWHSGIRGDGMDSHGVMIEETWPELCIGLLIVSEKAKGIPSREAMQRTVTTSALYSAWPAKVSRDLSLLKQAISVCDFPLLGKTAESNATTMHATMLSAWPPITYAIPETLLAMQQVWQLRSEGLSLYFTQDAGPNLKLLFLQKDIDTVKSHFPQAEIVQPFVGC